MRKVLIPLLLTAGCSGSAPEDAGVSTKSLDPIAFFTGRAEGKATLHKLFSRPVEIRVHSSGRSDRNGGVFLDQRIEESGKPARVRSWHLRPAGPGRFTGTLTDASGPVEASVAGPRLTIDYPMKGGLSASQRLSLRPDGRTLDNRLTVTKFGVRLAYVDEVITKTD